jgi:phosphoribosyl 1,2-cyclic phosphate phosphodiesterase
VKLRILGCGTSTGVPRIGSGWGQCDPAEPRNRRLRSSILATSEDQVLLVDCGTDLREQLLAAGCDRIDAVLLTHDHADHCHGIDDLRPLSQARGEPLPFLTRADTLERIRQRFAYAFQSSRFYPAMVEGVVLAAEYRLGAANLRFVDQPHGRINSVGMRFDEGGRSAAYAIDYHELTPEMAALYEGADVWISDCLGRKPHPTHTYLDAVLGWARELKVGQLYLTHLNNSMDYKTLVAELPDWAAPAHDGQEILL